MKIRMASAERVEFIPETDHEREALTGLWELGIGCDEDSKVLCPVGEYLAHEDEGAEFIVQDQFLGKHD